MFPRLPPMREHIFARTGAGPFKMPWRVHWYRVGSLRLSGTHSRKGGSLISDGLRQ
jgi:hypothetical protein